jgi:outer membrane protein assembly factor BamE (lipoprotein component of BamABCDE complex)
MLIAALMITGCATSGNPEVVDQEKVSQIQVGKSTQENVRSTLGEPQHVTKRINDAGQVSESWGYGYSNVGSEAATYIPIVGMFYGKSTAEVASLDITFTADGFVSRITRQNQRAESGPGAKPSPGTVVISR